MTSAYNFVVFTNENGQKTVNKMTKMTKKLVTQHKKFFF